MNDGQSRLPGNREVHTSIFGIKNEKKFQKLLEYLVKYCIIDIEIGNISNLTV